MHVYMRIFMSVHGLVCACRWINVIFFWSYLCARICAHHTCILHGCALCMHNVPMTVTALRKYRALSWKDRALLRTCV